MLSSISWIDLALGLEPSYFDLSNLEFSCCELSFIGDFCGKFWNMSDYLLTS